MRDNTASFKALERKLGRKVRACESCGNDLTSTAWFIAVPDRHNVLPEEIVFTCSKCFTEIHNKENR